MENPFEDDNNIAQNDDEDEETDTNDTAEPMAETSLIQTLVEGILKHVLDE